ncbi:MAG: hypothetical protein KJ726_05150 [Verrucomicrobia bacterium]|nr:hypothetical protein [Verrucomicrobiota bacterium]MBU1909417.1 hypothetical protein [Verrucomicrobiota bacterium]
MKTFILLATCALSFQAYADEITFNNGKKYSCDILYYSNYTFCLIVDGATQRAAIKNINNIIFNAVETTQSDFMADSSTDLAPVAAAISEYYTQPIAPTETVTEYIKKNKYGEALTTCDISDIKLKLIELEGKPIKLVFYYRYDIKQVNTNEYQVHLYDKDMNSVNMIFPAVALSYVKQVMERFVVSAVSQKKYALYGVLLGERDLVAFNRLYWYSASCIFVPLGRTMKKEVGGAVSYSW